MKVTFFAAARTPCAGRAAPEFFSRFGLAFAHFITKLSAVFNADTAVDLEDKPTSAAGRTATTAAALRKRPPPAEPILSRRKQAPARAMNEEEVDKRKERPRDRAKPHGSPGRHLSSPKAAAMLPRQPLQRADVSKCTLIATSDSSSS